MSSESLECFSSHDMDHLLQLLRALAGELSPVALLPLIARAGLTHIGAGHCRVQLHAADAVAMQAEAGEAVATPVWQLPLAHDGIALGTLHLFPAPPALTFTPRQRLLGDWIAQQAAQSLAQAVAHERVLLEHQRLADNARALHASQELLKQGERFNHTGSMRYVVREDRMMLSDELSRIYGMPEGQTEISYEEFAALMHPDDRRMVIETVEAAVAIGGTIRVQHRICRHDTGEVRHISGIGKPIWVDGSFTEYVGTATDITVRRQAEHAMRLAQADLARVSRATTVGQLTSSIAHEISQPLMSIVANAGASLRWLDRQPPHLDNARAGLRDIVAEGQRAGGMIAGLQGLSRNSGPTFTRLDLNETITHILNLSRSELERREVTLQLSLLPEPALVLGDAVQLQQVMLNLVLNAVEAMASVAERTRVLKISTEADSEQRIVTRVQDSGEGIAPDAMARIFDAFYTTKEHGMGMGLAICRSIIEIHHGRLAVEAAVPCGSTFRFELPCAR